MLKVCLILFTLFSSSISFASDVGNGLAISAGIGAVGTELGYGLFLGSPYWNEGRTSIQLGYRGGQLMGVPVGGSIQKPFDYSLLDITVINRFYSTEPAKIYFGNSALVGLPSDISSNTSYALKFSLGAEYQPKDWILAVFSEMGVVYGFNATADKVQTSPNHLTGVAFVMGLKRYLF